MSESILTSTKKILGIEESYAAYDLDIITHINSTFSTLTDLGVGPPTGFAIEDASALWSDLLGTDLRLKRVQQFVYLSVRLVFDPPQNSYAITAMEKQIEEHKWRINVVQEASIWTDPNQSELVEGQVLDGGAP